MRFLSALHVFYLLPGAVEAQAPIDGLIEKVVSTRKAVAEAQKAQGLAEVELKKAFGDLQKRVSDLGLADPVLPPLPVDPLVARLRGAFLADPGLTKAEDLALLVELMRQAYGMSDDPTIAHVGDLAGRVAKAAGLLAKDRLVNVRAVLKSELAAAFPEDLPLTDAVRAAAKATFLRLQLALTEAGK